MINVLEKIIEQRKLRGWSEYMLADKANIPQSTISSWYKKQLLPSLTSLEKICSAFDMSMAEFLMEESDTMLVNTEQKDLLKHWSKLTKEQKGLVLGLLKSM